MQRFWYAVRGLCLCHGLIFLAAAGFVFWQSARSLSWPVVPVRVVESKVMERQWLGTSVYWPQVSYEYKQNNQPETTSLIAFYGMAPFGANLLTERSAAEKYLNDRYAVDATLKARVNPRNHHNLVLEGRLISFDFLFATGLGLILLYLAWLVHLHMKHTFSKIPALATIKD